MLMVKNRNTLPQWMNEYLYPVEMHTMNETLVYTYPTRFDACILSETLEMPKLINAELQLRKQLDLLFSFFGIQARYVFERGKCYYQLMLIPGHTNVPEWLHVKLDNAGSRVVINNVPACCRHYNKMLSKYLEWCMINRAYCDNNLLLLNNAVRAMLPNAQPKRLSKVEEVTKMGYKIINCEEDANDYLRTTGSHAKLTDEECSMLDGYLEGHDYRLALDDSGLLLMVDVNDPENLEVNKVEFKEFVVKVMQWNAELMECSDNYSDEKNQQLAEDCCTLDSIFDRL